MVDGQYWNDLTAKKCPRPRFPFLARLVKTPPRIPPGVSPLKITIIEKEESKKKKLPIGSEICQDKMHSCPKTKKISTTTHLPQSPRISFSPATRPTSLALAVPGGEGPLPRPVNRSPSAPLVPGWNVCLPPPNNAEKRSNNS